MGNPFRCSLYDLSDGLIRRCSCWRIVGSCEEVGGDARARFDEIRRHYETREVSALKFRDSENCTLSQHRSSPRSVWG